ncbi:hypothetical protein ACOME3_001525 [Neoechinorhynchus agilis]
MDQSGQRSNNSSHSLAVWRTRQMLAIFNDDNKNYVKVSDYRSAVERPNYTHCAYCKRAKEVKCRPRYWDRKPGERQELSQNVQHDRTLMTKLEFQQTFNQFLADVYTKAPELFD